MIEIDDFLRVEMRVGRILAADPFPEARKPSYRLRLDFGPQIGERVSSAQLTVTYPDPAALVGRQVVAVVNFPPRRIAGFKTRCSCSERSTPMAGCTSSPLTLPAPKACASPDRLRHRPSRAILGRP